MLATRHSDGNRVRGRRRGHRPRRLDGARAEHGAARRATASMRSTSRGGSSSSAVAGDLAATAAAWWPGRTMSRIPTVPALSGRRRSGPRSIVFAFSRSSCSSAAWCVWPSEARRAKRRRSTWRSSSSASWRARRRAAGQPPRHPRSPARWSRPRRRPPGASRPRPLPGPIRRSTCRDRAGDRHPRRHRRDGCSGRQQPGPGNLSSTQLLVHNADKFGLVIADEATLDRLQAGVDEISASLPGAVATRLDLAIDPQATPAPPEEAHDRARRGQSRTASSLRRCGVRRIAHAARHLRTRCRGPRGQGHRHHAVRRVRDRGCGRPLARPSGSRRALHCHWRPARDVLVAPERAHQSGASDRARMALRAVRAVADRDGDAAVLEPAQGGARSSRRSTASRSRAATIRPGSRTWVAARSPPACCSRWRSWR